MIVYRYHNASYFILHWKTHPLNMNTLKSLVILSLLLVVATGKREKRSLSNWCRAFGCLPGNNFQVCAKKMFKCVMWKLNHVLSQLY